MTTETAIVAPDPFPGFKKLGSFPVGGAAAGVSPRSILAIELDLPPRSLCVFYKLGPGMNV